MSEYEPTQVIVSALGKRDRKPEGVPSLNLHDYPATSRGRTECHQETPLNEEAFDQWLAREGLAKIAVDLRGSRFLLQFLRKRWEKTALQTTRLKEFPEQNPAVLEHLRLMFKSLVTGATLQRKTLGVHPRTAIKSGGGFAATAEEVCQFIWAFQTGLVSPTSSCGFSGLVDYSARRNISTASIYQTAANLGVATQLDWPYMPANLHDVLRFRTYLDQEYQSTAKPTLAALSTHLGISKHKLFWLAKAVKSAPGSTSLADFWGWKRSDSRS